MYFYTVNLSSVVQDSATTKVAGQSNNYLKSAHSFKIGNQLRSVAENSFDTDAHKQYYKFVLNSKSTVRFTTSTESEKGRETLVLELYDKNGKRLVYKSSEKTASEMCYCKIEKTLKSGTYYLAVYTLRDKLPYKVKTSYVINKPTVKVTSPAKGKMTVKWNACNGNGYEVLYCRSKNFKSSKVFKKTITKSSTCSFTKTGLTRGKYYYVKVRAYKTVDGNKVYGNYSAVKSIKIKK